MPLPKQDRPPRRWPSSSTVSLVLVWPSTLMQLNDSSAASCRPALGVAHSELRVGHDHCEHRREIRADHGRALGHAAHAHRAAVEFDGAAGDFGPRVGRHHAAGGGDEGVVVGGQAFGRGVDPRQDFFHRHEVADDAGGHHQHLAGFDADCLGCTLRPWRRRRGRLGRPCRRWHCRS